MTRKQREEMNQFYEELDTIEGMEKTHSGDVDMPDNVPLIEEFEEEDEEEVEYSEEELEIFLQNINLDDSKTNLSFDDMMPQQVAPVGVPYQLKERVVTPHFLVLREYKKKSPSVCNYRDCVYCGAEAIGYKDWDATPEKKRKIALAALTRHVQNKHKFKDTDIIDESQIPTNWLSSDMI